MLLLALDTSTTAITVALHDGSAPVAHHTVLDARRHTEHLAPGIRAVLEHAGAGAGDVTEVAVGTGPGPFTGLRVGIVTALAFARPRRLPVVGVCSLDALAYAYGREHTGEFLVASDARRKEVYWARYVVESGVTGGVHRLTPPAVVRPAELPEELRSLPTAGRGPDLYPELFGRGVDPLDVDARSIAELALARSAAGADQPVTPLYLRRPDAAEPATPKSTLVTPRSSRGGR